MLLFTYTFSTTLLAEQGQDSMYSIHTIVDKVCSYVFHIHCPHAVEVVGLLVSRWFMLVYFPLH